VADFRNHPKPEGKSRKLLKGGEPPAGGGKRGIVQPKRGGVRPGRGTEPLGRAVERTGVH